MKPASRVHALLSIAPARTLLTTGTLLIVLVALAACSSDSGDEATPGSPPAASADASDEDVVALVYALLDRRSSPSERAELVAGGDDLDAVLEAVDRLTAQADSGIKATVQELSPVGDDAWEALVTIELSAIQDVRDAMPIGTWVLVLCRCDGEPLQVTALSFCYAIETLGITCDS